MPAQSNVQSSPGPSDDDSQVWTTVSLVGAIVAHLLLGFAVIRQNPAFWLDEYMGLSVISGTWEEAVRFFRSMPEQHPFHYLFLWVWVQVGDSESWLRAHSLLLSSGTVWVIGLLSRRLLRRPWTAHAAMWTYALSPFALTFATEARMYSLLMLLAAGSLLLLIRAVRHRTGWAWVGYGTVAGMCAWTHFFGVLLVLSLGLSSLWIHRKDQGVRAPLVWTHVVIALLFLPWLFLILSSGATDGQNWKGLTHIVVSAPYTALRFSLGYGVIPVEFGWQAEVASALRDALPLVAMGAAGFGTATVFYLRSLAPLRNREPGDPSRPANLQVLAALIGPMLLTFMLIPLVILAGDRYFVVSFPAFLVALWAGVEWATRSTKRPVQLGGWGAAALIIISTSWATGNQIVRHQSVGTDWKEVAAFLHNSGTGDAPVLVHPSYIAGIAAHYLDAVPEPRIGPVLPLAGRTIPATLDHGWLILSHTTESAEEALASHSTGVRPIHCETFPRGAGIRLYQLVSASTPDPIDCMPSALESLERLRQSQRRSWASDPYGASPRPPRESLHARRIWGDS